jgi:hypothetical protein
MSVSPSVVVAAPWRFQTFSFVVVVSSMDESAAASAVAVVRITIASRSAVAAAPASTRPQQPTAAPAVRTDVPQADDAAGRADGLQSLAPVSRGGQRYPRRAATPESPRRAASHSRVATPHQELPVVTVCSCCSSSHADAAAAAAQSAAAAVAVPTSAASHAATLNRVIRLCERVSVLEDT